MKGDKVIVRTYGNEPRICRVWGVTRNVIAICSEEAFLDSMKGGRVKAVGFSREHVFVYDEKIELDDWQDNLSFWEELKPYEPKKPKWRIAGRYKEVLKANRERKGE